MQHAKKLVLVDPTFLDQLQADREYKQIQKPADALAKTTLSLDIGRVLRDETLPEDDRVKLYSDYWRRYNNVRSEIPAEVKVESNPLGPVLPPPPPPAPEPKRRRRRQQSPPPPPPAKSKRHHKKPETDIPWVVY